MHFAGLTKNIILLPVVSACLLVTGGCAGHFGSDSRSSAVAAPVAASASHSVRVGLNGDLSEYDPVEFTAMPFSSLTQHSFSEEGGDSDPVISSDNKLIAFSSLNHSPTPDIYIKQVNGLVTTRLTSDPASEIQPAFSPAGDKIAYASNRNGSFDIWVIGLDGSTPTRLTSGVSNDIHPSWSPDGKEIVYCSFGSHSKQFELWTVSVENPSVKKWIGYGVNPVWSPNPKVNKIAFQRARYRGSRWFSIWTVDIIDGEAKYETEIVSSVSYACITPAWSADATMIAYSTLGKSLYQKNEQASLDDLEAPDASGEDIWVVDITGRNNHRITGSDSADSTPTWSPDGRLFFCSDRNFVDNIWSVKPTKTDLARSEPLEMSSHPLGGGIRAN